MQCLDTMQTPQAASYTTHASSRCCTPQSLSSKTMHRPEEPRKEENVRTIERLDLASIACWSLEFSEGIAQESQAAREPAFSFGEACSHDEETYSL